MFLCSFQHSFSVELLAKSNLTVEKLLVKVSQRQADVSIMGLKKSIVTMFKKVCICLNYNYT